MAFFQAGPEQLGQWFTMIDVDRSGQLSVQELQRALAQGGLVYSTKFVASLLSMFDQSGTGQATYQEFQQIHAFLLRCQQVYHSVDSDRSNSLNLNELGRAVQAFGFQLDMSPQGSFYTMCKSYDFALTGTFNLDVFIAMAVQLTNCKRMFDMFARGGPQMSMDFNQFVWSTTKL